MGRKMNTFFRSLTASLLALGILLCVLPAPAARQLLALPAGQDKATVAGHGSLIPADRGISNEAAFSSYVHGAMYFNSVSADRANAAREDQKSGRRQAFVRAFPGAGLLPEIYPEKR